MATAKKTDAKAKQTTKKSAEKVAATKTVSKTTTKATSKTATKAPAKTAKTAKTTEKAQAKTTEKQNAQITLEELHNEVLKIRAELEVLKTFNKKGQENNDDKIYKEIENIKETLYDINERFEELEYRYGDLSEGY